MNYLIQQLTPKQAKEQYNKLIKQYKEKDYDNELYIIFDICDCAKRMKQNETNSNDSIRTA